MKVNDIVGLIEEHAPVKIQEGFDNSGLVTGELDQEISGMLVCLDITDEVLDEAIEAGIQLIVSHHPLVFKGIKNLVPTGMVNRILVKAIRNHIAIYSAHTNLDKVIPGVSSALADQIGLQDQRILVPDKGSLLKLTTFIPKDSVGLVSNALFSAGAGRIGNYDSCSFQMSGEGTFNAQDGAKPFVGEHGKIHYEPEIRFEVVVPEHLKHQVVRALLDTHPYEQVAFDLIAMENQNPYQGMGIVGNLMAPMDENDFLRVLKNRLNLDCIRHTDLIGNPVSRVAVCGGSGSEFLVDAKAAGAEVFISGDFKYHQFFEADKQILIADIGHFESEVFALEILKKTISEKFANFAVHLSKIDTNPIKYY